MGKKNKAKKNHTIECVEETNIIDNDSGKVSTIKLADYTITDKDGDGYSMLDLLNEAEDTQKALTGAEGKATAFNEHLVLMAEKCVQVSTFAALCTIAEETKKWGRAPKGSPAHVRNLYHAAPDIYTNYKSKLLRSLESGIKPNSEVTLIRKLARPNKHGQTEVQEIVKLDTVRKMETARKQTEAKSGNTDKGNPGVVVNSKGEQKLVAKAAEQFVPAPDPEDGSIPMTLAIQFSVISDLFANVSEAEQSKAANTLKGLIKRLEKAQPATQEAAQAINA